MYVVMQARVLSYRGKACGMVHEDERVHAHCGGKTNEGGEEKEESQ
jgi:hypothetical protein